MFTENGRQSSLLPFHKILGTLRQAIMLLSRKMNLYAYHFYPSFAG